MASPKSLAFLLRYIALDNSSIQHNLFLLTTIVLFQFMLSYLRGHAWEL